MNNVVLMGMECLTEAAAMPNILLNVIMFLNSVSMQHRQQTKW